ncbi:MAG: GH92 family glycosyl hydrolase [Ignavibacteriales bacterium]|nr:GH92 family glycosyl hydrolase [Ignavibacteriales bacterium]
MSVLSARLFARSAFVGGLLACCAISTALAQRNLTRLVNPFVGTAKNGHTYPGATVPFGMVQLSPDTRTEGWDACSGYHYSDSSILGFSHVHLSGTGVADYGDILIMPTVGPLRVMQGDPVRGVRGYWSKFRHAEESASPGYYRVKLEDYGIQAELSATKRVGVHKYTFPKADSANIVIDLNHGLGLDKVKEASIQIIGDDEIVGFRRSEGWAKDQVVYFAAKFSRPFKSFGIALDDVIRSQRREASGENVKGFIRFKTQANETILVKVGLSSVSIKGARKNSIAEVPGWDFESVKAGAERAWNTELNRIWVDGGSETQRRTFYTALYHAMLAPNTFSDVDGLYRGMDGTARQANGFEMYSVFSLWDTFRAEHPLFTIIDRKRASDFVLSLLQKYEESGILPVWELAANETWCMIGYHAVPVILDAYVKGIRSFDAERALVAMKHSANLDHYGLKSYRENGYVAAEVESESVSKTLEYSYDDWCIAQFASWLGRKREAAEFGERGAHFRNLFDPSTGFMRAKENAAWVEPFDPRSVTVHYTEANAWQYSFFAPQDIAGLIELNGGRESFVSKLDQLFSAKEDLTGRNQLDISGMIGQYAQGNEPSHHVAYLYDYAGAPWKTQQIVRRILDSLYTPEPDGLCGNDDCGQMSAWYVFGAMGFYPVTPGLPYYSIGSPIFDRVTLNLENGKQFVILADANSGANRFIQSARLNTIPSTRTYIGHEEIMRGGILDFVMGPRPNEQWGSGPADAPAVSPTVAAVSAPVLKASSAVFTDSLEISMSCTTPGTSIYYSLAGNMRDATFRKYDAPLVLREGTAISFYAQKENAGRSKTIRASFTKFTPPGTITLSTSYSPQYTGGGDPALIDGRRGNTDFRLGAWQGYEGNDLDAVLDLGSIKRVSRIALGCLQDNNSWIFFPTSVEFSLSSDGVSFGNPVVVANNVSQKDEGVRLKEFSTDTRSASARYVRIRAKNVGLCPEWHKGAGSRAWLFVDEINLIAQ